MSIVPYTEAFRDSTVGHGFYAKIEKIILEGFSRTDVEKTLISIFQKVSINIGDVDGVIVIVPISHIKANEKGKAFDGESDTLLFQEGIRTLLTYRTDINKKEI